jgi:hypothetical protein
LRVCLRWPSRSARRKAARFPFDRGQGGAGEPTHGLEALFAPPPTANSEW